MSGGSWGYLCHVESPEEIVQRADDYFIMADRLDKEGFKDAAIATRLVGETAVQIRNSYRVLAGVQIGAPLNEVWRAVEWVDSCDQSQEAIGRAVEAWRKSIQ